MSFHAFRRFSLYGCMLFSVFFCRTQAIIGQTASSMDFNSVASAAASAREGGRLQEALADYQRALQIRPEWKEGWWYLGAIQYENNQYPEAIRSFHTLLQLDPRFGAAWGLLGLSEFEIKDYSDSLVDLEKAQVLGPGNDPESTRVSMYHLALLQNRNGEFDRAFATIATAFGRSQLPTQAQTSLGLSLLRIPLLPDEIDPSQDALIQAVGQAGSQLLLPAANGNLDAFRTLLKQYPRAPYLHSAYAMALASQGQGKEALLQEQKETVLSPHSAVPLIQISALNMLLHHPELAVESARKAVALAPNLPAARQALAQALQAVGKNVQAKAELEKAKALADEKPAREARILRMYAANSMTPAVPTKDKATGEWNLAMQYYSTRRFQDAISSLKPWVIQHPDDGTAWAILGLSEFEMKDYNNALVHLQRGQSLGFHGNPEAVQLANYHLAILLNRAGEFEQASRALAAVDRSATMASQIQVALGMSLLRVPKLPDQIPASEISLLQRAGQISELTQNSKYDAAFQQYQTLLRQYPDQPFLHYAYGIELSALSRYNEATAEMRRTMQLAPTSELPDVQLASIALRQDRPQDALKPAQHAVQLAPNSAEAHYELGRTYLALAQQQAAIHELQIASSLMPNSPEIHFSLAQAYAKADEPQKSKQERETFMRLNDLIAAQQTQNANQAYDGPHQEHTLSGASTKP